MLRDLRAMLAFQALNRVREALMSAYPIPDAALEYHLALDGRSDSEVITIDRRHSVTIERLKVAFELVRMTEDCWLFEGYRPSRQHGRIEFKSQQIYMHRAVYALLFGPIPEGMNVCHRCDVGNCIPPAHLFLGTQVDNIRDMEAKGRANRVGWRGGAAHPAAHLTDVEVELLRLEAAKPGTKQRDVATKFGVSQSTVWRLLHRMVRP
jgi:hypothetical protein